MKVISSIKFSILDNGKYQLDEAIAYFSLRYQKTIFVPAGYVSDGATGAMDIASRAWWIHDMLCDRGMWDDGTKLSNWQCSQVLQDILVEESPAAPPKDATGKAKWVARWNRYRPSSRYWQSKRWFWATFMFGGGEARENGMFKVGPA